MTEAGQIVDPQLAAFWASDPGQLKPPPSIIAPEPDRHRRALELAIAGAVVVAFTLVRSRLAARRVAPGDVLEVAREEWGRTLPAWLRAIVPSLMRIYELYHVGESLTPAELQTIAISYASGLGEYVNESSAAALQAGLQEQLNRGWNEQLAWQRAAAAYGLEARDFRHYLARVTVGMNTHPDMLMAPAARMVIDRATLLRADLIGRSEAWTSIETGKALAWMYMQQAGSLPADAAREWDTAEDESTCEVCAPLDRLQVALDEPFVLPSSGRKLWAPQAHPGCRCHVRLVIPEVEQQLAKAVYWRPSDHPRGRPGNRGEFRAKPVAEREREPVKSLLDLLPPAPTTVVLPDEDSMILPDTLELPGLPELRLPGDLPGELPSDLPASTMQLPGLELPGMQLTGGASAADVRAAWRRKRGARRKILIVLAPGKKKPPTPERGQELVVDVEKLNNAMGHQIGSQYLLNEEIDFSPAQRDFDLGTVRAEHYDAQWAVDTKWLLARNYVDPIQADLVDSAWAEVVKKGLPVWQKLLDQGDFVLGRLDPEDLSTIATNAGLLAEGEDVEPDEIRRAIRQDITAHPDGDGSLSGAYADYTLLHTPWTVGEDGLEFAKYVSGLEASGIRVGADPMSQVFVFNEKTARQSDVRPFSVVPTGSYGVYSVDYHSTFAELRENATLRPMQFAVQSLNMMPMDPGRPLREDPWR